MTLPMGTKKQFKMYLSDDLVERLKRAAEKSGQGSGQEVAEEILSIYLPVWSSVNDAMLRALAFQTRTVAERVSKPKFAEARTLREALLADDLDAHIAVPITEDKELRLTPERKKARPKHKAK